MSIVKFLNDCCVKLFIDFRLGALEVYLAAANANVRKMLARCKFAQRVEAERPILFPSVIDAVHFAIDRERLPYARAPNTILSPRATDWEREGSRLPTTSIRDRSNVSYIRMENF